MRVIETTAPVGPDGMLRLEVPLEQRDRDVHVAVVVESPGAPAPASAADKWAPVRSRVEAAGIRVPPPGVNNAGPIEPMSLYYLGASAWVKRHQSEAGSGPFSHFHQSAEFW